MSSLAIKPHVCWVCLCCRTEGRWESSWWDDCSWFSASEAGSLLCHWHSGWDDATQFLSGTTLLFRV